MSKDKTPARPEARLAKGFRNIEAAELAGLNSMLQVIRGVYERYGFEALETPAIEYTDALGKFLPDQDRPNAGVFSFQDEDEQWMSLRYDLTAPLARYVAQNFNALPKPFRRYAFGPVYRNEKPGPGRFRQFMQFDADTVGAESVAADAEICMLAADTLEALGIKRGDYIIKVNSRKVLDGVLELAGVDLTDASQTGKRLTVLRAMDKFDKFGVEGVAQLLGKGRKDESGDFTPGAGLAEKDAAIITAFLTAAQGEREGAIGRVKNIVAGNARAEEGMSELETMATLVSSAGYDTSRIAFDPSVVRGLEYYTGPVYEAELLAEIPNEDGKIVRFGSVGGGGRYDGLVSRFRSEPVPATGFSIGVSRLQAALAHIGAKPKAALGPVIVTVMDKPEIARYQAMVKTLRDAGIRAELYLGSSGMKAQMKYADKRNSPCVVMQGSNERADGNVTLKDLIEGAKAAAAIKDNAEWKAARPAQLTVPEADLVAEVRKIVALHSGEAS